MYTKLFEVKKWLNVNSKQDKEYGRGHDITLLSEIIANSRYWQAITTPPYRIFTILITTI
jgi:hypothetical protein